MLFLQTVFCFPAELDLGADRRFAPALYFFIDAAVDIYRASFFFIDHVVRLEKMGFLIVGKLDLQNMHDLFFELFIFHWKQDLHPFVEVPWHPVRTAHIDLRISVIFKIIDPGVLQEGAYDGTDADGLAHAFDALFETADSPDDQVDLHAGCRGVIKSFDDSRIAQGIHLGDDLCRPAFHGIVAFPLDQCYKFAAKPDRRQGELIPRQRLRVAG